MPKDKKLELFSDSIKINILSKEFLKEEIDKHFDSILKNGLTIEVEATHSGFVNRNGKFYIPSRMKNGVDSINNASKPLKLLKHHKMDQDPIGVIVSAEYVDTTPSDLANNPDVQILNDSNATIKEQLNAVNSFIKSGIPFREGFKGLGYIKKNITVYDKKAVDQLETGLFDAVSTSFVSPGHVYCSICKSNLATDGYCEHERFEIYEDENGSNSMCFWIPGLHKYQECSLVNQDADPYTKINIMDSVKNLNIPIETWNPDVISDTKYLFMDNVNNKEDNNMPKPKDPKVFDLLKELCSDMTEEDLVKLSDKISDNKDKYFIDDAELDYKTAVQYALDDINSEETEINADDIYALYEEELSEDAKLSASARKNLPDSAFCGPNRSFPAHDCAHVTAARRLISRYKGPGSKSAILACVNRKAKAMGCDSSDSVETQKQTQTSEDTVKFELPSCSSLKDLNNEDAFKLLHMVEAELIGRKLTMKRECADCAKAEDRVNEANQKVEDIENELKLQQDTVRILRSEYKNVLQDYMIQADININKDLEVQQLKAEKLSIMGVISGKYETTESVLDAIKDSSIEKQEAIIKDSFDLVKICDKLNNGITNHNPEVNSDQVTNPIVNSDNTNSEDKDKFKDLSGQAKRAISSILDMVKQGNMKSAKIKYAKMVSLKVFKNLDFDDILNKEENNTN